MLYSKDIIEDPTDNRKYALFAMRCSLATVFILTIIKLFAVVLSDSTAMLGSLIDTLGDVVISLIGYFSVKVSLRPADKEHRHGHGKIEGFSALLQSSFLFGSAIFLGFESLHRFTNPEEISHHILVIVISGVAAGLTIILVNVQRYVLKRAQSLIVEADQKHYIGDIALNIGVILALGMHLYTDLIIFDTMIGLVIATYIGFTGFDIGKKATDMLMDREISEKDRDQIIKTIKANKKILGMHDLRTRQSGMIVYISFDIELDSTLSLRDAHDITRDLEFSLLEDFPHAEIIIHMDPQGDTYDTRHKVQGIHD